ncbi:MAG TPA: lipid-A-disaccharide synthase, partial [Allocoleopsis sp.]
GVMNKTVIDRTPPRYVEKLTVVGDLMAEAGTPKGSEQQEQQPADLQSVEDLQSAEELIGILPGSKPSKLAQGVPLGLAIADCLHAARPQTRFVIPVAPTLDLATLAKFADPAQNPIAPRFGEISAELITDQGDPFFKTRRGVRVDLWTGHPAYDVLTQCRLCFTTVGANTAELGSLAIPMIVMIPTQQLDAMRSWDGIPGLLVNLPGVGTIIANVINGWFLSRPRLLAWPNIWAGEMIVPQLVGELQPQKVAELAIEFLDHPDRLAAMQKQLRQVRGEPGAAEKFAQLVQVTAFQ